MSSGQFTIPIFVPDLACPQRCVFCSQKNILGKSEIPSGRDVKAIVLKHLTTIPSGSHVEIGFFGGNFTGIDKDLQTELLLAAKKVVEEKKAHGIRLSTRPDYISNVILDFLQDFPVTTIELGAQSFDDEVLKLSQRGHDSQSVIEACKLIKERKLNLGLQMMLGLPGDTKEKSILTARKIAGLKPACVRIYPVVVIRGTQLQNWYDAGKYCPLSVEEAVDWCKEILNVFDEKNINVIRTGLHPSEGLINKETYVAGPFHVSFRELVFSELWKDLLKPLMNGGNDRNLIISVAADQLKHAIGYGSVNKKMLQNHFRRVKFVINSTLKGRLFHADYC